MRNFKFTFNLPGLQKKNEKRTVTHTGKSILGIKKKLKTYKNKVRMFKFYLHSYSKEQMKNCVEFPQSNIF